MVTNWPFVAARSILLSRLLGMEVGQHMQELQQFARVIIWLDDARWAGDGWWEGWDSQTVNGLTNSQKILAHWVTYVADMRMPARIVWGRGLPVLAKIVADYNAGAPSSGLLKGYQEEPIGSTSTGMKGPTLKVTNPPLEFTPRYKWQYDQIQRTLELLDDYGRSLPDFMKSLVQLYGNAPGALRRLAHALYILTYANPRDYPKEKARRILVPDSRTELEADFQRWDRSTTKGGQKRLWAALRDYLKHKELRRCLEGTFIWPSQYLDLSQLELPGDIWNERFTDKLLCSLAEGACIPTRTDGGKPLNSATLARQIYCRIKSNNPSTAFYPEQLDVSFDFASRMCDKRLCDICVFGKNEAARFCSEPGPGRLCAALLITCGYKRACAAENCPVRSGAGSSLCKSAEANS